MVYQELLICLYHASGDIWPELGSPCAVPAVYEYPTYVCLDQEPDVMLEGDAALFEKKLEAIACFASQKQMLRTADRMREAGPVEFCRNLQFAFYHPAVYKGLFAARGKTKRKKAGKARK